MNNVHIYICSGIVSKSRSSSVESVEKISPIKFEKKKSILNKKTAILCQNGFFKIPILYREMAEIAKTFYHYINRGFDVLTTIFGDFRQFSAKNLAFLPKTNVMIKFLLNVALFWVKNTIFSPIFVAKLL
jgi:hypothetical protein